ncbi:hypothetical protein NE237_029476 [Protea cynaroides]|uniref:Uncharacterized protein n=1 Tax=Protea cynaroides TaxID=273540 RepID=A0A9Q0GVW0_9MAGN|nr:hypothetical protein NE237_029476 [Protea cynaroides]
MAGTDGRMPSGLGDKASGCGKGYGGGISWSMGSTPAGDGGVPNGSWNNNDRSQSGSRDSGASAFRGGKVQSGNPFLGNGGNLDQGPMPQSHQVGMAMGSSTQAAMSTVTAVASSSGNNHPGSLPNTSFATFAGYMQLEAHLHELQIQLENLMWDKIEAEDLFQLALKDCRILETIVAELEEEHEKAIARIEQLENEIQDLKYESLRLNEVQGKGFWDFEPRDVPVSCLDVMDVKDNGIPLKTKYGVQSLKTGNGSGKILQGLMMHGDDWEDKIRGKTQSSDFLKIGPKTTDHVNPFSQRIVQKTLMVDEVLEQRKRVALSRTLFSAILSLLVGMIIWEAEDPCTPLVVALFTVVGISSISVLQFFSTIKNRPASDAVALLSFNWFILGILTYPTLPRVAHMLTHLAVNLMDRAVG